MKMKSNEMTGLAKSFLLAACLAVLSLNVSLSSAADEDSYSHDVERMSKDMTTVDCARCHYDIFTSIRNGMGAHRLECNECHETYHSFRKGGAYGEVLPKCSNCHDAPHGDSEQMLTCAGCHIVPHAPLASLEVAVLKSYCGACHTEPEARVKRGRSDHSRLQCVLCHSEKHGYVPDCRECHGTPHVPSFVEGFSGCLECHGNPHDLSLAE